MALYAVIKGVPKRVLDDVVASKLAEVGLSEADGKRLSSGYSGGMKRKLSVACATIGSPQIGTFPCSVALFSLDLSSSSCCYAFLTQNL